MTIVNFIWNPDQNFLDLDLGFIHFQLRYYSLMFIVAFSLGYFITKKIFINEGKDVKMLDDLFVYVAVATLVGARLGHVFFYDWDYYRTRPEEIILPFRFRPSFEFTGYAGLASHGAAIGIILSMFLYVRKYPSLSISWVLDRIVPAITIGGMFVRIGNFMNSEINGSVVSGSFPFGVKFLQGGDLKAGQAMELTGQTSQKAAFDVISQSPEFSYILDSIPYRHPAQLYEAFCYFLIFWLLWYIYWKTDKRNQGFFIFGVFLISLWSVRFLIEFIKESQGGFEESLGLFSTGQWLSIPFIIAGVYLLFYNRKYKSGGK